MARPRKFSETDALENAMQLFWTNGYHAASTRDIEKALGMGRQSVYNAFGDKETLFHLCLDRYRDTRLTTRLNVPVERGSARRDVVRYLAGVVEFFDSDPLRRGCFLYNAVAELSGTDPYVLSLTRSYIDDAERRITDTISAGIQSGEIREGPGARSLARALITAEMGLSLASRAGQSREFLVDVASAVLQPLY